MAKWASRLPPMSVVTTTIVLSLTMAGCGADRVASPTAPTLVTPPASPLPSPTPAEREWRQWTLTTVLVAVTGPDVCFAQTARQHLGPRSSVPLLVNRSRSSVRLQIGDPQDYPEYSGTVEADDFTAQTSSWPANFPDCPNGTALSGTFDGRVAGRFTQGGEHLTATDIWSYRFPWGEVQYVFEWTASAQ